MTLSQLIAEQGATDPVAFFSWLYTPSVTVRREFYLSYRTLGSVLGHEEGLPSHARLEAIAAFIESQMPTVHDMLKQCGNTDGSRGGVDVSLDATRGIILSLVGDGATQIRQAEADAILAMGETLVSPAQHHDINARLYDVIVAMGG